MAAQTAHQRLAGALSKFPSLDSGHWPTPIEPLSRLGSALGIDLFVKRDDCTGIAFGGNKVRQLNYYLGAAKHKGADTVLITGAVQSNFVRTCAAMAAQLGMACHIQLEARVPNQTVSYTENGNVLLDRILGATLSSYPDGEDEAGADAELGKIADRLRQDGKTPFIVPLSGDSKPTGALGYAEAALELHWQEDTAFDAIIIASGSALTHSGLLLGLRALGDMTPVHGVCVRRGADLQAPRVHKRCVDLANYLGLDNPVQDPDINVYDGALAPGYGQLSDKTRSAITRTAQLEGLILDPVYTGKVMAGLFDLVDLQNWYGKRILFWHTGGQSALFGYGDSFFEEPIQSSPNINPDDTQVDFGAHK